MVSLNNVNPKVSSQVNFTSQQTSDTEKKAGVSKYLTAPNIVIGSLATIGVLGMADILISKGRHINKLTGRGRELEEAVTRATNAETKLGEAETRATNAEQLLSEVNNKYQDIVSRLKKATGIDEISDIFNGDVLGAGTPKNIGYGRAYMDTLQNLYEHVRDLENEAYSENILKKIKLHVEHANCKLIDKCDDPKLIEDYFEKSFANVEHPIITRPAIIDKNGCLLNQGVYVFPLK